MTEVRFEGFEEFLKKLKVLPEALRDEADGEAMDAALMWVQLASGTAPKDKGFLSRNIREQQVAVMQWDVTSGARYSPYKEWGTGSRAVIPADLLEYASQWWTKRKHAGIHPHPYFFMHREKVQEHLTEGLKRLMETEH